MNKRDVSTVVISCLLVSSKVRFLETETRGDAIWLGADGDLKGFGDSRVLKVDESYS